MGVISLALPLALSLQLTPGNLHLYLSHLHSSLTIESFPLQIQPERTWARSPELGTPLVWVWAEPFSTGCTSVLHVFARAFNKADMNSNHFSELYMFLYMSSHKSCLTFSQFFFHPLANHEKNGQHWSMWLCHSVFPSSSVTLTPCESSNDWTLASCQGTQQLTCRPL